MSDDTFPMARDDLSVLALASLARIKRAAHEAEVLVKQGEHRRALQAITPLDGWAHETRAVLRSRGGL